MKSVYLAGPIAGLSYRDAMHWREVARERLTDSGIEARSPMRGKEYLANLGVLPPYGVSQGHAIGTSKGITTRDRMDVTTCDLVLMNLLGAQQVSIGSMIEAGWADAARRPLVLVMDSGNTEDLHYHGMLMEIAGFVVTTLGEALDLVEAILLPDRHQGGLPRWSR